MKYAYKARTKDGKLETGSIEAYSKEAALSILQKYSIFITSLEEFKDKTPILQKTIFQRKVPKKDLAAFFKQLSVMLDSHVPVVQSLSSLADEMKKNSFRDTILKISKLVQEGLPLSQALLLYPQTFSNFQVNLVKSGEASGKVASALYSISIHLEREHEIASQIKQAIIYPLLLVCILFFVIGIIVTQIVPKIESLAKETGGQLTSASSAILGFYKFLANHWPTVLLLIVLVFILAVFYLRTNNGKKRYSEISLHVPFLGKLLKKAFLVRFCSNLSILLVAGVSASRALEITKDTIDNAIYKKVIADVERRVSEGEKLSTAMAEYPNYFTPFVLQITKVGEATGKLDKTLTDVIDFYEKEIKRSVDLFSRLFEPVMIIILGIIVTMLAVSVLSLIYGAISVI